MGALFGGAIFVGAHAPVVSVSGAEDTAGGGGCLRAAMTAGGGVPCGGPGCIPPPYPTSHHPRRCGRARSHRRLRGRPLSARKEAIGTPRCRRGRASNRCASNSSASNTSARGARCRCGWRLNPTLPLRRLPWRPCQIRLLRQRREAFDRLARKALPSIGGGYRDLARRDRDDTRGSTYVRGQLHEARGGLSGKSCSTGEDRVP